MAKIRAIIIEGEMTPAELKQYADSFWYGTPAASQQAVATTEVDLRGVPMEAIKEINKTADAPSPPPAPAVVVEAPAADDRMARILACQRGVDFIKLFMQEGKTTLEEILAECRVLQPNVPRLHALGASMEDRLTRTFEGMK